MSRAHLKPTFTISGSVALIAFAGELDTTTAPRAAAQLHALLAAGAPEIPVDLTEITPPHGGGIGAPPAGAHIAPQRGGGLYVFPAQGPPPPALEPHPPGAGGGVAPPPRGGPAGGGSGAHPRGGGAGPLAQLEGLPGPRGRAPLAVGERAVRGAGGGPRGRGGGRGGRDRRPLPAAPGA